MQGVLLFLKTLIIKFFIEPSSVFVLLNWANDFKWKAKSCKKSLEFYKDSLLVDSFQVLGHH